MAVTETAASGKRSRNDGTATAESRRHSWDDVDTPPDTDTVRTAVRLGWYLAELRGRYWWQGARPARSVLPAEPPFALPLRPERTPAEARKQSCETVVTLVQRLAVVEFHGRPAVPQPPFPERLMPLLAELEAEDARLLSPDGDTAEPGAVAAKPDAAAKDAAWSPLAALLHEWDACLQDGLAARADVLANAYLLGRGLAETYWALGPDRPPDAAPVPASALQFLLGPGRRGELSRLVARVGAHLDALTPAAVAGSLEAWGAVAADPAWRAADRGRVHLYEQLRRWYELLVLGRDPTTYVKPYAVLRGWRTSLHAFRAFLPQLLLAAASVAAVAALVVVMAVDRGTVMLSGLLGLGGAVGLTTATVSAKAKSGGQRLLARLRQDAYSDLVAIAISSVPAHPHAGRGWPFGASTEHRIRNAVRRRRVTPVTPMLDIGLTLL